MTKYLLTATFLLLLNVFSFSQKYTLSGYVESAETGEKLAGAAVYVTNSSLGTMTNTYGFFSITIPESKIKLTVAYIGFASQTIELNLIEDKHINFSLTQANEIEGVEIVGQKSEAEKVEMGKIDVSIKAIQKIPALLGLIF